jgi:hypothetical protein
MGTHLATCCALCTETLQIRCICAEVIVYLILQALLKGADVYGDPSAVNGLVEGKGEHSSSQNRNDRVQSVCCMPSTLAPLLIAAHTAPCFPGKIWHDRGLCVKLCSTCGAMCVGIHCARVCQGLPNWQPAQEAWMAFRLGCCAAISCMHPSTIMNNALDLSENKWLM